MNKDTQDYIKSQKRGSSGYKKRQQQNQTSISLLSLFLILLVVGCIAAWMMGLIG